VRLTWPLSGRSEEMRLVEAAIAAADVSGIVVCGAAGVGKSRVAREALSAAASQGCEIRWVVATSSARAVPLGAFASWAGSAASDPLQLIRSVIESLTSAPAGTRVVVGVDDVNLLDDLSTFVLHQIVQRRGAKVVMTLRDGEPIPAGVQDIWKGGQFDRLDLQPLSRDETTSLVSATLGGSMNPDAAGRLWKLTRGNVLYLRNIVEQEVADGRLIEQQGYWRWTGDPIMPPGLIEMVESRIGALPASVGDVVDVLAVGEPLELSSLTRITDAAAVEEADTRGLITLDNVDETVQVRVAHPLYGEVRRERAPSTRLRRLRGLVATELAASDTRDDLRILLRRATLSLDSDLKPDPALLVRAARRAIHLLDLPLAERLARASVVAGGGFEAELTLCYARTWQGRGAEADRELAALGERAGSDPERVQVVMLRAVNLFWTVRRPAEAEMVLGEAEAVVTDSIARQLLTAPRAAFHSDLGRPRQAVEAATEALAAGYLTDQAVVLASWGLVGGLGILGRADQLGSAAERGYAAATGGFDAPVLRLGLSYRHMLGLRLAGYMHDADDVAVRAYRYLAEAPGWFPLGGLVMMGHAELAQGHLGSSLHRLREARAGLQGFGDVGGWLFRCLLGLTQTLAMTGEANAARQALAELEDTRHPGFVFLEPELMLARAWAAAAAGTVIQALALAHQAAASAAAAGQSAHEVMCLQTATQFGDHSSAVRLHELEAIVEGPRVGLAARFAEAVHAGDGAELAAVSEEFERMGDLIAAVDAAAHAAVVYRGQGLRGSAMGCSTRADELAQQCGGASTPALRQASERLPLTDREREIVMLIGEGLSNRAVAERLTLSVRTVESHIYRAMAKTGVTGRDELGALIRPRPLE
jgi:DNA-binding CsgD family transcriptional regulator